jgi:hypothetical protein
MCGDCKELCLAREMLLEFGCPHCRSTLDVLYVGFDYLAFDTATMRINGHVEKIDISERAVRRLVRTVNQAADIGPALQRSSASTVAG